MSLTIEPSLHDSPLSRHVAITVLEVVRQGGDFEAVLTELLALRSVTELDRSLLRAAAQISRTEAMVSARNEDWDTVAARIELALRTHLFG